MDGINPDAFLPLPNEPPNPLNNLTAAILVTNPKIPFKTEAADDNPLINPFTLFNTAFIDIATSSKDVFNFSVANTNLSWLDCCWN